MYENMASRINFINISIDEFNQLQPIYAPFWWRQMRHIEGFILSFPQLSIKIHFELKTFTYVLCFSPHPLIKLHWNLKNSTSSNAPELRNRLKPFKVNIFNTRLNYSRKLRKNSNHLRPTRLILPLLICFFFGEMKIFPSFYLMVNLNNKRDGL